jgi:hypothetical protein
MLLSDSSMAHTPLFCLSIVARMCAFAVLRVLARKGKLQENSDSDATPRYRFGRSTEFTSLEEENADLE